jgi:hypothetical protein
MTPLAGYILELAKRAHEQQLSEQRFLDEVDLRILATSMVTLPDIGAAIAEIRQSGDWPWPLTFSEA